MPTGLSFEEWFQRASRVVETALNGRYSAIHLASEIKWRRCFEAGMSPLNAFIHLAPPLNDAQTARAHAAYETMVKSEQPDYLEITRSIAGG